ncbi:MAG: hypothetical protein Q9168_006989 [Polycauliona sp. 1 TL-2023]
MSFNVSEQVCSARAGVTPVRLAFSAVDSSAKHDSSGSSNRVEIAAGQLVRTIELDDPFADSDAFGKEPEKAIKWYLEKHVTEPFETTKADFAAEALVAYGRGLAAQIVRSGLVPTHGPIELEIRSNRPRLNSATVDTLLHREDRNLQQLHWELLEDNRLWPPGYNLDSVSVLRSVRPTGETVSSSAKLHNGKRLRILLVVSRPGQHKDLDYQLVSACLVAVIDHVSQTDPSSNVSLKILRPPTWQAFREHLQDNNYDLVHLDMHGEVQGVTGASATAVLAFCKQDFRDPLKMRRDFRTGDEVGKELRKAGVKTVILNACNSANFHDYSPGSNLAEVLLGHGVELVLAMAYEVVEEAVEIFMDVFYQSLLIKGLSVQDAVRSSRLALRENRSRRAPYMHNVELSDYMVPVLYTSCWIELSSEFELRSTIPSRLEHVQTPFESVPSINRGTRGTKIPVQRDLTGRDSDVLSLELLLSVTRLVLVHGEGGCGKSELLRYVCRWWKSSGWIKGSAYIDFADKRGYSLDDFLERIGDQLGIAPGNRREGEIVDRLRSGKYLVVFDSADALEAPISLDMAPTATGLSTQLKCFIDAATQSKSMVIVSSRQATTKIANIRYLDQKYHLTGISILASVELLLNLGVEPNKKLPESFQRRENIDYLRRVAILLEGNPGAIQMIVPALKLAKYNGETLLNELLYGVWKMDNGEWEKCRFVRSIYAALLSESFIDLDVTLVSLGHLAMFWTLMPQNLDYYYWFLYLSSSTAPREGSFGYWITQDFEELVEKSLTGRTLRKHWPGIEEKLLRAGILEHAVVTTDTGEQMACYHVHPILTLIGRSWLSEEALKEAKFAYVRQMLLWEKPRGGPHTSRIASVAWGETEQHEDYVHNLRAVAMAWSLDGDPMEEVERMGLSMFDCAFILSINSLYVNQRQPTLFIPLIWRYLLEIHMLVTLVRPSGAATREDLGAILSYSYEICRVETDDRRRLPLVIMALEAAEYYRATDPSGKIMGLPKELSWFQLRHIEANIAESNSPINRAKKLYERNLADDPCTNDNGMSNAIRRCQLQNLTRWANCVAQISAKEGTFPDESAIAGIRELCGEFKAGNMISFFSRSWVENEKVLGTMTVRDQLSFSIQKEKDTVLHFGNLANSILDGPIMGAFAELADAQGLPPDEIFTALNQTMEKDNGELRALFGTFESSLRMLSGDTSGAASALKFNMQREALSSTTSTGRGNLSDMHMHMYELAVTRNDDPDYKKGLTHLTEWWKQHKGINVPTRDLCNGHFKFAVCHHGLGNVAETARAVIKCAQVARTMTTADCAHGDHVEGFSECLHDQFASLDKLDIFADPKTIVTVHPIVSELLPRERIAISQIMKKAREARKAKEGCEKAVAASTETMEKLRRMIQTLGRDNVGKDVPKI